MELSNLDILIAVAEYLIHKYSVAALESIKLAETIIKGALI